MKKFLIMVFTIIGLFANEIVITKFLQNKPDISIKFSGDRNVLKILKMDLKVLDHFNYKFNNAGDFEVDFEYRNKILTVKYIKNSNVVLIKKYKSNSYAFFPFLVHKAVYDLSLIHI
jgi:TolB protein